MYNVLVVEDEVNILKLMTIRLKKSGFNVFNAENGEEALAVCRKEEIDIIVRIMRMNEAIFFKEEAPQFCCCKRFNFLAFVSVPYCKFLCYLFG